MFGSAVDSCLHFINICTFFLNYSSILDPQVPQDKTSVTVAPTAPGPTRKSRLEQLLDLQVEFKPTHSPKVSARLGRLNAVCVPSHAVAHQNGGLKNTNHSANQRNSQHHSQRNPSHAGSATRPFLPTNIQQQRQRGGSRQQQQPNYDCLKVPEQGAAG